MSDLIATDRMLQSSHLAESMISVVSAFVMICSCLQRLEELRLSGTKMAGEPISAGFIGRGTFLNLRSMHIQDNLLTGTHTMCTEG